MLPSMYAKLFSRIAQSSLMEEDVETRYCFMMLLAIADSGGDVIGTDVALARTVNLPLDTFKRCVARLMEPDADSNSQVHEGRRLVPSESGRGYRVVNYCTYRSIKTAEEKKAYMREYMAQRRKALKDNDVTDVKNGNSRKEALNDVTHSEGEEEADPTKKEPTVGQAPHNEVVGDDSEEEKKLARENRKIDRENAGLLLNFLNAKAGTSFRPGETHLKFIAARLGEDGVDPAECEKMIVRQVKLWKGTEMAQYLRPETLFNPTKFATYFDNRNQPVEVKTTVL
jgi:uncharacterized phage protein (TIGR02220 family)